MGDRTPIQWTDATWNPVTGCDRTSPGCDNCYALALARRLKAMHNPRYQIDGDPATSGPGFKVTLHQDLLALPRRWRRPRRIFVNSMSDLFHPDVPDEFILEVFSVMEDTPRHLYQILTKRSKRLRSLGSDLPWPANVWMGVSVETQLYTFRLRHLSCVPAAVRFVSAEPLLGALDLTDWMTGSPAGTRRGLDWVIAGGESGPGHREMRPEWARSLRDQCSDAEVPFFFKQWGGPTSSHGGRDLDGATHDYMPRFATAA